MWNFLKRWWSAKTTPTCNNSWGLYHIGPVKLVSHSSDKIWCKLYCTCCEKMWSTMVVGLCTGYPEFYHEIMGTQWVSPPAKSDAPRAQPAPTYENTMVAGLGELMDSSSASNQTLDQAQFQNTLHDSPLHTAPMYGPSVM